MGENVVDPIKEPSTLAGDVRLNINAYHSNRERGKSLIYGWTILRYSSGVSVTITRRCLEYYRPKMRYLGGNKKNMHVLCEYEHLWRGISYLF